jgi:hypothetical protein
MVRPIVTTRVIPTARRITFDFKPHIEIATRRAIRTVKVMKIGRAYLLKRSVQHPITIDRASKPTETMTIIGTETITCWKGMLL